MTAYTMTIPGIGAVKGASVSIRHVNRSATTLTVADMALAAAASPIGADEYYTRGDALCLVGKWIYCGYGGAVVFRGVITSASRRTTRGATVANSVVAKCGWYFLERVPYVQEWMALPTAEAETTELIASNRVVLNQNASGSQISAWEQIMHILACAKAVATAGVLIWVDESGFAAGTSLADVALPFDELRDVTCAQALERVLRFFPDISVAFISQPKRMCFRTVGTYDATPYVDTYGSQIERLDELDDTFIDGVRVEIVKTGSIQGTEYSLITAQTAGATDGYNIMHGSLELAGRDANRTRQKLDVVSEAVGDIADAAWWKAKCPQVFGNVAAGDVVISNAARSGEADKASYPNITVTPAQDIAAAGLLARVETFSCVAEVVRRNGAGDVVDVEKALPVQIQLVTTNATTRSYKYTTSSTSTTAEPEPDGLAAALLAAHAGDGRSLTVVGSLPDSTSDFDMSGGEHDWLPEPGDTYDGMVAQSVQMDFPERTMTIQFGPPSHLSIQDMAGLMTGFRARRTASTAARNRDTGETGGDEVNMNIVAPAQAVQAGQGRRERFVVANPAGAVIDSDPAKITSSTDKTMEPRTLTLYKKTSEGLQPFKICVMATAGADDGDVFSGGGLPDGTEIPGRVVYSASGAPAFKQYTLTWNAATQRFVESGPAIITTLESHSSQHS